MSDQLNNQEAPENVERSLPAPNDIGQYAEIMETTASNETVENVVEDEKVELYRSLFKSLVNTFSVTAKQQLGKLTNPVTGTAEKDLDQAFLTIEMIKMLKVKTFNNLSEDEQGYLDDVLARLQNEYDNEPNS